MLVLAMEFSRGVQRPQGTVITKNKTGELVPFGRTSGRADLEGRPASLRRDWISLQAARRAGTRGHSLKTE